MNPGTTNFGNCANTAIEESESDFRVIDEHTEVLEEPKSDDWPPLVPLDALALPNLDLSHLPGWAGNFARSLAAFTESPPELAAGLTLAACSTAAARRLSVLVKPGHFEPCNLWVLVALPSGNRKSGVQTAVTAPLLAWEHEQAKALQSEIQYTTSENKTLEARAKELRTRAAKEKDLKTASELGAEAAHIEANLPEIPKCPQLWTSDATPERLGVLLAEHGECMAWQSTEGGVFDLLAGRYSNGIPNLDLILKAHSGDAERVDRGSRPAVFLSHPLLTIGLSPQPEILRGLATKPGFRGRGLLARFLYLLPPSPLGFRKLKSDPMPERITKEYADGLRCMLDWPPATDENGKERPHVLRLSPLAFDEWLEFARTIEVKMRPSGDLEHFTDWAGKAPGAAARLAGVLHGIEHTHDRPWDIPISRNTMTDALELMAVISLHSMAALSTMGGDPNITAARRVWEWIGRGRRVDFSVRDAFEALKGQFPRVKQLREALEVLEERAYIEITEPIRTGPGRPPSPKIKVRPDIVERWK